LRRQQALLSQGSQSAAAFLNGKKKIK